MDKANGMEAIFKDFKGRRAGLIRALTIDADKFFLQCDPEKDELCLYGLPTKQWEVKVPVEVVPQVLPEPAMGINFARDLMDTMDWLSLVAIHSDAWLLAVALFYAANVTNDKSDRAKLFTKINNLPTVLEVFTDYMKNVQEGTSRASKRRNKSSISESQGNCSNSNPEAEVQLLDEENDDKNSESFCRACGEIYVPGEFWIFCDVCEKWFHGLCVKITPAKAEHIKLYRCPSCNKKGPGA